MVIGISFGMEQSTMAGYVNEMVCIIPTKEGAMCMPNVFAVTEEKIILVGEEAMEYQMHAPETKLHKVRDYLADVDIYSDGDYGDFSISSVIHKIMSYLISSAEDFLDDKVTGVVLAVPNGFHALQMGIMKRAVRRCGISQIKVRYITDMAAVYYSVINYAEPEPGGEKNFMIADLNKECINIGCLTFGDEVLETVSSSGVSGYKDNYLVQAEEQMRKSLKDAELSFDELDDIYLTGELASDFLLRQKIKNTAGKVRVYSLYTLESSAYGALIYARRVFGTKEIDCISLVLMPSSIFVHTVGDVPRKLIDSNHSIPSMHSDVFKTTEDHQTDMVINIYEGDSEQMENNVLIGRVYIDELTIRLAGETKVEIAVSIDSNYNIEVKAKEVGNENNTKTARMGVPGLLARKKGC